MNIKLLTKVLLLGLIAVPTMSQAQTWTDKETSLLNKQFSTMSGKPIGDIATFTTMSSILDNNAIKVTTEIAINIEYKDGAEESVNKSLSPFTPFLCQKMTPVISGYSNVDKVEMKYIYTTSDNHKINIQIDCN